MVSFRVLSTTLVEGGEYLWLLVGVGSLSLVYLWRDRMKNSRFLVSYVLDFDVSVTGASCRSILNLSIIFFYPKPKFFIIWVECSLGSIAIAGNRLFWPV